MNHASHLIALLAAISVLLAGCVGTIPTPNDEAPIDPLDGVCGSLAGEFVTEETFESASGTQLCADSTATDTSLSSSTYSWTCPGLRGGESTVCQASLEPVNIAPEENGSDIPQPGEAVPQDSFRGWYYDNSDFTNLYDTRIDNVIAFDWEGAPINGMGPDSFSVEWQGRFTFREGYYDFFVEADDGVRIYVDDLLVFDEWREQDESFVERVHFDETRVYTLRVLHYDNEYSAEAALEWEYVGLGEADSCVFDTDCASGKVCERTSNLLAGECVEQVANTDPDSCEDDTDCANGEVCSFDPNVNISVCEPVENTGTEAGAYDGEILAWEPYRIAGSIARIENYEPLDGRTVIGPIRVRAEDDASIDHVVFSLNDDPMNEDGSAPYEMRSGTNNELSFAPGAVSIDAAVHFDDGSVRDLSATFSYSQCSDDAHCSNGEVCSSSNTNGVRECVVPNTGPTDGSGTDDPLESEFIGIWYDKTRLGMEVLLYGVPTGDGTYTNCETFPGDMCARDHDMERYGFVGRSHEMCDNIDDPGGMAGTYDYLVYQETECVERDEPRDEDTGWTCTYDWQCGSGYECNAGSCGTQDSASGGGASSEPECRTDSDCSTTHTSLHICVYGECQQSFCPDHLEPDCNGALDLYESRCDGSDKVFDVPLCGDDGEWRCSENRFYSETCAEQAGEQTLTE